MTLFIRFSSNYFFYFALLGLVSPFLSVYLDGEGFSSVDIGEILAIMTATKIVAPSLWAILADRTGEQLTIIRLGALFALLSFSLIFYLNSFWPLTFALALFSLFWSAILPQLEVFTLNSVRNSSKIYARVRLWGSTGFIVLAVVSGQVISLFGYDAFFMLGLVVLLLLCAATLTLKQAKSTLKKRVYSDSISTLLFETRFVIFFISGVLLQISFGPFYSFFALLLRDLSYPGYAVGLLISIGVFAEIVVFIYAGLLFKYFSVKSLLIFSLFFTSIRWILVAFFADSAWILSFTQLLHAVSFALYHSASMLFISKHFKKTQQSRGQAIYLGGVYGLGGAIGAYVAGTLWSDGEGAKWAFLVAALAALLASVLMVLLTDKK